MRATSLLDTRSKSPEDHIVATLGKPDDSALHDLALTVRAIASNYATKEEIAVVQGQLNVITNNYVTKQEMAVVQGQLNLITDNYVTKQEMAVVQGQLNLITDNYVTKQEMAVVQGQLNVITDNYVTKQEMAVVQGQLSVMASNQQIFQAHALQSFATKAELSHAVNQLTWRMAGFTITLIGAIAASARYL